MNLQALRNRLITDNPIRSQERLLLGILSHMGYCLERYPKEEDYTKTAEWKRFGSMRGHHRH
jgi:hypothetical protein